MKYWHSLPQSEVEALVAKGDVTWRNIMDNYKQPDWCGYPEALSGLMGCWSLATVNSDGFRMKICKDYCKTCDCFIDQKK